MKIMKTVPSRRLECLATVCMTGIFMMAAIMWLAPGLPYAVLMGNMRWSRGSFILYSESAWQNHHTQLVNELQGKFDEFRQDLVAFRKVLACLLSFFVLVHLRTTLSCLSPSQHAHGFLLVVRQMQEVQAQQAKSMQDTLIAVRAEVSQSSCRPQGMGRGTSCS